MTEVTIVTCVMFTGILALAGWRELRHESERRELYNRLMARDLMEYTTSSGLKKPPAGRNFIRAGLKKHFQDAES